MDLDSTLKLEVGAEAIMDGSWAFQVNPIQAPIPKA